MVVRFEMGELPLVKTAPRQETGTDTNTDAGSDTDTGYQLSDQVGHILRRANQRHVGIFAGHIPDLTPTQFAALAKLCEAQTVSQNELGRRTAMDAATIKGVVDRLRKRGYVNAKPDPGDQRRVILSPSAKGRRSFDRLAARAHEITTETLSPLTAKERDQFLRLLAKLT